MCALRFKKRVGLVSRNMGLRDAKAPAIVRRLQEAKASATLSKACLRRLECRPRRWPLPSVAEALASCKTVALLLATATLVHAQDAPRVGELAPSFSLVGQNNVPTTSDEFWGRSQFWILEGDTQYLMPSASVARGAAAKNIAPLFITPNTVIWPAPFQTLRDELNTLAKLFGAPTFVAVDRAGWVRDIEPLPLGADDPGAFALRFLLERSPDPTPAFSVGKPAPDFCLRDAGGIWRRLSSLRGRKNLVLTFFPRCFTGKCKSHLGSLRDNFGAFQLNDTEIWAVSTDAATGEQGQNAFARSLGTTFPMLPDVGRNVCFLFDTVQTPTDLAKRQSVLIDKDGIVRFVDREIVPETHGEDLLARLQALGMIPK